MHFQHDLARPIFGAAGHSEELDVCHRPARQGGAQSPRSLIGWILATSLVIAAVFGPPLTGQSIPALVQLRHDMLMIDREFERLSTRIIAPSFQTGTVRPADLGRGSTSKGRNAIARTRVL